jgi:hypothetical protein
MTELEMHWHEVMPFFLRDVNTINLGCGAEQMPRIPAPVVGVDENPNILPPPHYVADCRGPEVCNFLIPLFRQVISSHLLEDYADWESVLEKWLINGLTNYGGRRRLILLVPDKSKFRHAVALGQPDNLAHKHEFTLGELTSAVDRMQRLLASTAKLNVLVEKHVGAYSILFAVDAESLIKKP